MRDDYDPYTVAREFHPFRWIFFAGLAIFFMYVMSVLFGLAALPFRAVNQATTVANRIISADNMLTQYRWFHDANAKLETFPSQIKLAKEALTYAEQHAPDRASARDTEFTGIRQVCMGLVGEYNSRAQRIDSGFFRNPERWLPIATSPWAPLPESYTPNFCNGE